MHDDESLQGYQRAALMRAAHHLSPVASVGRAGDTPELRAHIERELDTHELIKVRFVDYKGARREIITAVAAALHATVVAVIGNVGILYRQARNPEKRHIVVPQRRVR